jgi:hypothetical protein
MDRDQLDRLAGAVAVIKILNAQAAIMATLGDWGWIRRAVPR